jgi:hypothetical protein
MKFKMKFKISILFIFNCLLVLSQESEKDKIIDLFQKTQKVYESSNTMQINMDYNLYSSYTTNKIYEKTNGLYLKENEQNYTKIGDTEIINLNSYFIKIDHSTKLMNCTKKSKKKSSLIVDLKSYALNYSVFNLASEGNNWLCTLTTPEFSQVPYTKIVVYINKKNLTIHKQVMFMITTKKFKINGKNKEDFPRLEIIFSSQKTKDISFGNKFKLENYIVKDKNKINTSKEYKAFKIIE